MKQSLLEPPLAAHGCPRGKWIVRMIEDQIWFHASDHQQLVEYIRDHSRTDFVL